MKKVDKIFWVILVIAWIGYLGAYAAFEIYCIYYESIHRVRWFGSPNIENILTMIMYSNFLFLPVIFCRYIACQGRVGWIAALTGAVLVLAITVGIWLNDVFDPQHGGDAFGLWPMGGLIILPVIMGILAIAEHRLFPPKDKIESENI
jgi:hypothetical protein